MVLKPQIKHEVETSMKEKLDAIEDIIEGEKKKSRDCKSAIKKRMNSLFDLLNGEDINSEEEELALGGNDADGK